MTTIFSNSPRSQTLFLYGHQTPSLVETRYVQTSASGIYPERIYTGQTEPPLRLALRGGWRLGLNTTDYGLKFYMDRRAAGVNFVTGGTGILTFISAIDQAGGLFQIEWVAWRIRREAASCHRACTVSP